MIISWMIAKACQMIVYPFRECVGQTLPTVYLNSSTVDDTLLTRCKDI